MRMMYLMHDVVCLDCKSSGSCRFSIFFVKQKTAYELRISDWSSDVCSSDLLHHHSTIADETWLQLTEHFPNDQVVELIFSSSFYHMAAFYLNSTAVPLEDGSQRFPEGVMQASV